MLQVTPARTFNTVPHGLRWIPLDEATGAALWATGLQKGRLHDEDGAEVVCVDMVFKAGYQPTPRYIKRWMGPNGKWRYAYAAHEGGGVHNAAHFGEGARFKHGEGHYEVGKDGTATHSHTGHKVNVADLSAHLHEHHKADIDAHRKKVLANLIGQIGEAATAKHKAALEKKAAAYGYKPGDGGKAKPTYRAPDGFHEKRAIEAHGRLKDGDPKKAQTNAGNVAHHVRRMVIEELHAGAKTPDEAMERVKARMGKHERGAAALGDSMLNHDAIKADARRDAKLPVVTTDEDARDAANAGRRHLDASPSAFAEQAKPSRGAMVATPDGKMEPKKAGLSDDEHADTYDEMVRLRNELSPGGLNTGPKGAQRTALEAKLNAARAKLGLKPHTDDPMKADPGETGARQRAMGIREKQRQARASAKEASAKKEAPSDADLDWSGGAAGIPMSPARSPESEKKTEAKAPENLPDRLEHTAPTKSHIRHVEWTADNPKSNKGTLRVHFKDGHVHDHYDRHRDIFHKLATAESVGKAYNEHVKGIGESKTVRRAEGDIKKEARETARQNLKETKTAQVKETVRKYEEQRGGGEPQGVTTPKPEAPARESEPSPRRDHYEAAQKTYGLSDRDMQLIKRRADGAVSQHVKLGDHDKAQAAIKDAVHRHVFQDRNMSPSQATKWMKEQEGKAKVQKALTRFFKALATPWVEIPEDMALALMAKAKGHKYIKKVPTGKFTKTGKPRYRYYYKVGLDTHAAEHFKTGASFADGKKGGHWHIHAHDGDKLHLKHDETGEERHLSTRELSDMLHSAHNVGAVETAAKERAQAEVAEAKKTGSAKTVAAARKRAEKVGVKDEPEPAKTEAAASEPATVRHTFIDDPGDDKRAPGSIYRNGKGGKVYVSLDVKSRKGNRSDEDHNNYVPPGKVENSVTAREATPEEVARYEEWAAGPVGPPRPKADVGASRKAPPADPATTMPSPHMPEIKALRDQIVAINTVPPLTEARANAYADIKGAAKALAGKLIGSPEAAHIDATLEDLARHASGTTNADVSRLDAILAGRTPDAPAPAKEPESPHGKQVQSVSEATKAVLSGKTYEARETIKRMGGRWDAANKVWVLPVKGTMRGRADTSADLQYLRKQGVSHTLHKALTTHPVAALLRAFARAH